MKAVLALRQCTAGILDQQLNLLKSLSNEQYVFHCPHLKSSTGGHVRHSFDHLRLPLHNLSIEEGDNDTTTQSSPHLGVFHYDKRSRDTPMERNRDDAIESIHQIQKQVSLLEAKDFNKPVIACFMLSSDGEEQAFQSTLGRELAFAVHHCVHHNAMIKQILQIHFPEVSLPPDLGMAPSTLNFIKSSS